MRSRRRSRSALAALAAVTALLSAGAWGALAQVPPLDDPVSSQPPDEPAAEPPPPEDAPAQPTPGPPPPSDGGGGSGEGGDPEPGAVTTIPPEFERLMRSVRRTPANNTRRLLADLGALQRFGFTPEQAAIVGMGRFPVAGEATFVDDWWFPRWSPQFHLHVGTDIFAAHGTPVRAPVDGRVRITNGKVGGLAVYVHMRDNTYFYLAHLSALAPGLTEGQTVRTGQVVGYVGDSGNARGGKPHVHFEIHPRGGAPINPKPYLDKFIADARAQVPRIVEHYAELVARRDAAAAAQAAPPPAPAPKPLARLSVGKVPAVPLLWAASMSPVTGGIGLAEAELAAAAQVLDWTEIAGAPFDAEARAHARALLAPITPPPFASLL